MVSADIRQLSSTRDILLVISSMDQRVILLHTAARKFCDDQYSHWAEEYQRLEAVGKARVNQLLGAWDYSKQAYTLFPRYRLDEVIQNEVEKLTLENEVTLHETRRVIVEAANRALSTLLPQFKNSEEAITALKAERDSFERYVTMLDGDQLRSVPPLPYRRVLQDSESSELWDKLKACWSVGGDHYWYPLSECPAKVDAIAFHDDLWQKRNGTGLVLNELKKRGIERCFVLRESPPDFEIEVMSVDPTYDGSESFVTSDFGWLLYVSHESSITAAGWLAEFLRQQWNDWRTVIYGGPFHTSDLRGTWNFPDR